MNPECDRCLYNAHSPYFLCAVHPEGVEQNCLDSKPDPTAQEEWSPHGYFWYDGELIAIHPPRLTVDEQLAILDNHPFFTGVCPSCHYLYAPPPLVHWDCPACGWVDDSV